MQGYPCKTCHPFPMPYVLILPTSFVNVISFALRGLTNSFPMPYVHFPPTSPANVGYPKNPRPHWLSQMVIPYPCRIPLPSNCPNRAFSLHMGQLLTHIPFISYYYFRAHLQVCPSKKTAPVTPTCLVWKFWGSLGYWRCISILVFGMHVAVFFFGYALQIVETFETGSLFSPAPL